ncbi:MAG: PspA/IM30 family protein [Desulfosalsimonadaceae bacterium]
MGIMTRFTRLFKADIHGVMDQMENKELVLKQCLREMEESLTQKQGKLNQLNASLDQVREEIRQLAREKEKIEKDLEIAIEKEKDDIARLLIKKRMKTDQHLDASGRQAEAIEKQMGMLGENIEAQKHQYAEMQLRSESWFQRAGLQKWEEGTAGIIGQSAWNAISDEEVELELMKCRDARKGGE